MSIRPDPTSPWGKRLWIPDSDFDAAMDALRHRANVTTCVAGQGIDVDAILKFRFDVDPEFATLDDGCLGRTTFLPDGTFVVAVCRTLADEAETSAVARRRLRSTLAHECAHIELHGVLHPISSGMLFDDMGSSPSSVMCRDPSAPGLGQPWWEYQANRGMASLLLPRELLRTQMAQVLSIANLEDVGDLLASGRTRVVLSELADHFDVSLQMMVYRLQAIGLLPESAGQLAFADAQG